MENGLAICELPEWIKKAKDTERRFTLLVYLSEHKEKNSALKFEIKRVLQYNSPVFKSL